MYIQTHACVEYIQPGVVHVCRAEKPGRLCFTSLRMLMHEASARKIVRRSRSFISKHTTISSGSALIRSSSILAGSQSEEIRAPIRSLLLLPDTPVSFLQKNNRNTNIIIARFIFLFFCWFRISICFIW